MSCSTRLRWLSERALFRGASSRTRREFAPRTASTPLDFFSRAKSRVVLNWWNFGQRYSRASFGDASVGHGQAFACLKCCRACSSLRTHEFTKPTIHVHSVSLSHLTSRSSTGARTSARRRKWVTSAREAPREPASRASACRSSTACAPETFNAISLDTVPTRRKCRPPPPRRASA